MCVHIPARRFTRHDSDNDEEHGADVHLHTHIHTHTSLHPSTHHPDPQITRTQVKKTAVSPDALPSQIFSGIGRCHWYDQVSKSHDGNGG